ncbi:phage minor capsid protein [Brevibacillus brevis]|uniref:phage minor capsid protein n=1 Tax=Brevibacillus brevis TaxID=1393 RepID=UPI000D0E52CA|nr:phage minor capsid protein [Brevibacillus brevis]PSJ67454.1 hypothetical protein C7J99_20905 [Brevibacillus brevis]RED28441.1 minor capsid protein 2 [Brevibacillus brevis]GEC90695.1 hypothetical protein BBR01nite_30260 [Brevibacillus brevis]VEF91136.1 Phage minor capsid protein 2 [Brevibacillus brevis]
MNNQELINALIKAKTDREINSIVRIYQLAHKEIFKLAKGLNPYRGIDTNYYMDSTYVANVLYQLSLILKRVEEQTIGRTQAVIRQMAYEGHLFALSNIAAMGVKPTPASFSIVKTRAVEAAVLLATRQLRDANNTVMEFFQLSIYEGLEKINKEVAKQRVNDIVSSGIATGRSRIKTTDILLDEMKRQGLTAMVKSNGHKMNLSDYADIVVRSQTMQAYNFANVQTIQDNGFDLVRISKHANPCKKCQPYEGKVYSISGEHPEYPSINILPGGIVGSFHPRCRHTCVPYIEKFN